MFSDGHFIASNTKSINIKMLIKAVSASVFVLNDIFQCMNGPVDITRTC